LQSYNKTSGIVKKDVSANKFYPNQKQYYITL